MPKSHKKKPGKAVLLGVGLDSDGHKRVTTGPNFALVGGTQETHEEMTEKAIKINEKLAAKGKSLESVSHDEFSDIAHSVGLQRAESQPDRN
jgi:seryl-tRNA(Sec) selenium transferase